jgi:hypothetical protein
MARKRDGSGKKIRHKQKKCDQDATSAADLKAGDASDAKDAGITPEREDAGRSANEATQDKTTVSLSGNLSKLKQFPRLILTY